jgi:hypothetical protein
MKHQFNLRDLIAANADHETLMLAPVGIEIDELFDFNGIAHEQEVDIDRHDLLRKNRQIAHLWGIEDVQDVRGDLTEDQAWQVLQECDRRLDSTLGITWENIEFVADDLFGPARGAEEE